MRVIHIGYPKTGTTYLQSQVFGPMSFAGYLRNYVGNNGRDNRHTKSPLNFAFASLGEGTLSEFQKEVLRDFVGTNRDFFISVEATLGNFGAPNPSLFASRLANYLPRDTQIVITVRDFQSIFDSAYQQVVKGDFLESPNEFFREVGPKRRHKLRRRPILTLEKYDLDAMVRALLEQFTEVIIIEVREGAYFDWLAELAGISVHEIKEVVNSTRVSSKSANYSLSSSSVRVLQAFNLVSRYLFMAFGVRQLTRLDQEARARLNIRESFRYRFLHLVMKVKSKLIGLLRVLDTYRPGQKYSLPRELREELVGSIPVSNLYLRTMQNGGFLKVTRETLLETEA